MRSMTYVGLDVHKKAIAYCARKGAGKVIEQGEIRANRRELGQLAQRLKNPGARRWRPRIHYQDHLS